MGIDPNDDVTREIVDEMVQKVEVVEMAQFIGPVLPAPVETEKLTLDAADADALEAGIVSVFDSILAGEANEMQEAETDDGHQQPAEDPFAPLLTELDRLWARAA